MQENFWISITFTITSKLLTVKLTQVNKKPPQKLTEIWQGHEESNLNLRFWRPLY